MIGIGLHIGNRVMGGGGAAFDVDAQAFFDRVAAAGGTLTTTEQNATNQLVLDMKSAGIWTSMKAVYPMVGASAAACAQNLKSSSFTGTFTSGWTFASTGVTPNGTSAYMDTNLLPSTQLTASSTHISYYSRTQNTTNNGLAMGSYQNGYAYGIELSIHRNSEPVNKTYTTLNSNYSGSALCGNVSNTQGYYLSSRTSSSSLKMFKNATSIGSYLVLSTLNLPSYNLYLAGSNEFNTAAAFFNKECSLASIGDGLTDTQASDFYTAVQIFNTTLGRQVAG
jgi:hypothetical protein